VKKKGGTPAWQDFFPKGDIFYKRRLTKEEKGKEERGGSRAGKKSDHFECVRRGAIVRERLRGGTPYVREL